MIKVVVTYRNDKINSLEVSGHANSAPHGEDLVCSAVSAIVTGGANAINNKKDFDLKISEGYARIKSKNIISKEDEIVLDTIVTQLKTIEESYAKFIKIEERKE